MISPMNWGGRTRTYNFLINSPSSNRTARESLPSHIGRLGTGSDGSTPARRQGFLTSSRTFPRTWPALSLVGERQKKGEVGSRIGSDVGGRVA